MKTTEECTEMSRPQPNLYVSMENFGSCKQYIKHSSLPVISNALTMWWWACYPVCQGQASR